MLTEHYHKDKLYFSIGEVAAMFNVNTSLIRFWEKEFDILKPTKNKKGNRLFTRRDVGNLKLIFHLVKERGYTLEGARKKLKYDKDDVERDAEIIASLQMIRGFLMEISNEL